LARDGLEVKGGGGEVQAEMISFLRPGSSQSAFKNMMSSPPPPPPCLGNPTENSRQVLNSSCIAVREWGRGVAMGREKEIDRPSGWPRQTLQSSPATAP
jgi:hypothetical protein